MKAPTGNGIAAIGPNSEHLVGVRRGPRPPRATSRWARVPSGSSTRRTDTVARMDPETKADHGAGTQSPGVPTDLAAGAGAYGPAQAAAQGGNWTVTVYRVDPRTAQITTAVQLPGEATGGDRHYLNGGFSQIAVGAGGVWATGGGAVARIDPDTGRLLATVDADAYRLAAGREGVWYLSPNDSRGRDADRPAHEPRAAADQRRRCQLVGHRRRRRVRVGHGGARGCSVAHQAGCQPGHDADRRRVRGQLRGLRRRRRLGGQLSTARCLQDRPGHQHGGREDADRCGAVAGGRSRLGLGEHRGGDARRHAAGGGLRRCPGGLPGRRSDRLRSPVRRPHGPSPARR